MEEEAPESETGKAENRKLFPLAGRDRAGRGGCRAVVSRPGQGPSSKQQPPCASASGGHQERPLEGADHCRELLAPLWSQSREVSWAKRRPEAASSNHEFTDTSSCQSGLKPWPWKQPAGLRDLCLQKPEPSPHLERSHSGTRAASACQTPSS